MSIRTAHNNDVPDLQEIERISFSSDILSARQMKVHCNNPNALFLVFEKDKSPVGYLLIFRRKNRAARIYSIVVSPAYRGYGIAKRLLESGLSQLQDEGIKKFVLEVDAKDEKTISLYRSFGFHEKSRIPGYYEDGRDALKMMKEAP